MNYLEARQITDGPNAGKWHFTSANRRSGIHPVGGCSRYRTCGCGSIAINPRPDPDCEKCDDTGAIRIPEEEWLKHAHDTAEEAQECYRQYELDRARFEEGPEDPSQLFRCRVEDCEAYTAGYASVGSYSTTHLCDDHRNRENLEPLVARSSRIWSS